MDVWSGDLYTVPTGQIRALRTLITIVGGKVVSMVGDVLADGAVRANDLVGLIRLLAEQRFRICSVA